MRRILRRAVPARLARRRLARGAGRAVLLTFDDGPVAGVTDAVLDRLATAGIRAAFFVLGERARRRPELLRRARADGHLVGNHTDRHDVGLLHRPAALAADLRACQAAVAAATGEAPRLWRPPEGRLTPAGLLVAARLGLRTVLWSLDRRDWSCRDAEEARRCGRELGEAARGGDIILLHDFGPAAPPLLEVLLPRLADRGLDPAAGLAHLPGAAAPAPGTAGTDAASGGPA